MVPDEFPQDTAHTNLLLGSQFLAGDGGVFVGFLHLVLLEGHLYELVAQVDEGDARGVIAAVHHHIDSVSEFLIVIEEMNGIGVVIHSSFILEYGAKIGIISKLATFWPTDRHFFTPYINMSRRFRTFAPEIDKKMTSDVINVIIGWAITVVAFFVLWAILLKVIKRISERKSQNKDAVQEKNAEEQVLPKQES